MLTGAGSAATAGAALRTWGVASGRVLIVVARAADLAHAHAVVGGGGGGTLDLAKAVALLATNTGGIADWIGVVEPPVPVAPLLLVPTTTGTDSEATRISMITIDGAKRIVSCAQFVPLAAVLDADLVADLPAAMVASHRIGRRPRRSRPAGRSRYSGRPRGNGRPRRANSPRRLRWPTRAASTCCPGTSPRPRPPTTSSPACSSWPGRCTASSTRPVS